ncbi:MAG: hypothetical protein ABUL56_01875 [Actinomycetota bacterium]
MKTSLASLKFMPAYSTIGSFVGAFVAGATMLARDAADPNQSLADPPSTWLAGALDTTLGAILFGIPAIIGALLRYFAYRRLGDRFGSTPWLSIPIIALEVLYLVLALLLLWASAGPEESAGWMWLFYLYLSFIALIVSAAILVGSLLVKARVGDQSTGGEEPDGMVGGAHTLPTA